MQPEVSNSYFLPISDDAVDEYYKYTSSSIFSVLYGSVDEKSGKCKNILIFVIVHMNTNVYKLDS
jgi:hypothetical protein